MVSHLNRRRAGENRKCKETNSNSSKKAESCNRVGTSRRGRAQTLRVAAVTGQELGEASGGMPAGPALPRRAQGLRMGEAARHPTRSLLPKTRATRPRPGRRASRTPHRALHSGQNTKRALLLRNADSGQLECAPWAGLSPPLCKGQPPPHWVPARHWGRLAATARRPQTAALFQKLDPTAKEHLRAEQRAYGHRGLPGAGRQAVRSALRLRPVAGPPPAPRPRRPATTPPGPAPSASQRPPPPRAASLAPGHGSAGTAPARRGPGPSAPRLPARRAFPVRESAAPGRRGGGGGGAAGAQARRGARGRRAVGGRRRAQGGGRRGDLALALALAPREGGGGDATGCGSCNYRVGCGILVVFVGEMR